MLTAQRLANLNLTSARRWVLDASKPCYIAIACYCVLSSVVAVAQVTFGWYPFPVVSIGRYPGLFYNPVASGAAAAICVVLLVTNRLYLLIPSVLPGLYLAHSRGGWAALSIGLLAQFVRRPLWLLIVALGFGLFYSYHPSGSDQLRLEIWRAAWTHLTFWGNGFGSFWSLYMGGPGRIVHPEYVHNDYLQTVFEFGVWSVIPFTILAWAASRTFAIDWPALITFLFMACFVMPVHMPVVATLGAIALTTTLLETLNA